MLTREQIKQKAKGLVKNNLGALVGLTVLYLLISIIVSVVSEFFDNEFFSLLWLIITIFIGVVLSLGYYSTLMKVYKFQGKNIDIGNLFDYFRQLSLAGKAFFVFFVMMIIFIIIAIILAVVMIGSKFSSMYGMYNYGHYGYGSYGYSDLLVSMLGISFLYIIVILIIYAFISILLQMPIFLVMRNPNIGVGELFSKTFSAGFKYIIDYFVFQLSFIGWWFLVLIPVFLGAILAGGTYVSEGGFLVLGYIGAIVVGMFVFVYESMATVILFDEYLNDYYGGPPNYNINQYNPYPGQYNQQPPNQGQYNQQPPYPGQYNQQPSSQEQYNQQASQPEQYNQFQQPQSEQIMQNTGEYSSKQPEQDHRVQPQQSQPQNIHSTGDKQSKSNNAPDAYIPPISPTDVNKNNSGESYMVDTEGVVETIIPDQKIDNIYDQTNETRSNIKEQNNDRPDDYNPMNSDGEKESDE